MKLVDGAGHGRRGIGVGVAAALILLGLTRPSWGAVESVQPPSGSVVQGASASATVTLSASLGCVSAGASDPTIVVTVGGLPVSCGVGPRNVSMNVQTTGVTPVGSHQIAIREVNSVTLEIDLHSWPLEVLGPAPTTTTTTPTTTTTTTQSTTSTTTSSGSTTAPSNPTTTTRAVSSTTTSITTPGSTTNPGVVVFPGGSTTTTTTTPGDNSVVPVPGESAEPEPAGDSRLWEEIRRALSPVLAPRLLDVLLSPLIIIEMVLAALLRSGRLILVPIAILGALVGWALRRWLPEIRALYSQRVQFSFLHAKGEK